jgi:hypothetical protein
MDWFNGGDNFPILYLRLIKFIRSASIDRFDRLKANIRKIESSQFPGQYLEAMSRAIQAVDAMKLDTAGQYDHNLTLAILDSFIETPWPSQWRIQKPQQQPPHQWKSQWPPSEPKQSSQWSSQQRFLVEEGAHF